MDEQLSLLIQLQELDSTMRSLLERKKKVPDSLAALDQRRASATADVEKVKEDIQAAQKDKRDRDKDLDVGSQKVEKLKARTSEIKTNKEYQALLKEIETAEQENKTIEDDILQLMEKIDAAASAITGAEQRARQEEAAIQVEQKEIEAASARLEQEIAGVEQVRQQLLIKIQPAVLKQYQILLDAKAGVALAEARGETCSGCYMSIPPQVFVNVKKNEGIIPCPQCGRILYYKEVIAQKGA